MDGGQAGHEECHNKNENWGGCRGTNLNHEMKHNAGNESKVELLYPWAKVPPKYCTILH